MTQTDEDCTVAGITLHTTTPTPLSFDDLYTWVVWQFPKQKNGGLCGAVHPPIADHGWFPAIIQLKKKRIEVYGHLGQCYSSPELAADHFFKSDEA